MRRRRPPISISLAAVAAVSLLAAGCGGGLGPGVASVTVSTSTTSASAGGPPSQAQIRQEQRDATRFARCMRSHGMPNFPDPTVAPRAFKNAFDTRSPEFQPAYNVCRHLLPPGRSSSESTVHTRAQTVALLGFAHCLRSHGFPAFPDPTASGELTHEMLAKAGIDLHETAVVQAADACTGVTHGVITKAIVANFVAGH